MGVKLGTVAYGKKIHKTSLQFRKKPLQKLCSNVLISVQYLIFVTEWKVLLFDSVTQLLLDLLRKEISLYTYLIFTDIVITFFP